MLVRQLHGHTKGVDTVLFAHNGRDLLTASEAEGNACIWRFSNGFKDCKQMTLHCEISESLESPSRLDFTKCRSKVKLSNCLWSLDDSTIISSSWLKRVEKGSPLFEVDIKLWDAATGNILAVLNRNSPTITGPVANMYLYPSCPWILVTCCWSGKISFWDIRERRLLRT